MKQRVHWKSPEAHMASEFAAEFRARTGQPIMVHPAQYRYFKAEGVDTKNLRIIAKIPFTKGA